MQYNGAGDQLACSLRGVFQVNPPDVSPGDSSRETDERLSQVQLERAQQQQVTYLPSIPNHSVVIYVTTAAGHISPLCPQS